MLSAMDKGWLTPRDIRDLEQRAAQESKKIIENNLKTKQEELLFAQQLKIPLTANEVVFYIKYRNKLENMKHAPHSLFSNDEYNKFMSINKKASALGGQDIDSLMKLDSDCFPQNPPQYSKIASTIISSRINLSGEPNSFFLQYFSKILEVNNLKFKDIALQCDPKKALQILRSSTLINMLSEDEIKEIADKHKDSPEFKGALKNNELKLGNGKQLDLTKLLPKPSSFT